MNSLAEKKSHVISKAYDEPYKNLKILALNPTGLK